MAGLFFVGRKQKMEQITGYVYYPISINKMKKLIKKYYGRDYIGTGAEGYLASPGVYLVRSDMTTHQEAAVHMAHTQAFRETGKFCPLWMLLSVLGYRKEIPEGRYLLRVDTADREAHDLT